MSDMMRITGMATGLDVDTMVKQMMKAENVKLDKVKQDRQLVQWKQDTYREILGDINTFKSTFFDVTKPDSYMLSSNNYAGFDVTTSDGGTTSSTIVNASAGAGATAGQYSIRAFQLAKAPVVEGTRLASNTVADTNLSDLGVGGSTSLQLTYNNNGINNTVSINIGDNSTISDVINAISSATSGSVSAKFSQLSGKFSIETANTGSTRTLSLNGGSSQLLSALGLTAGEGTGAQDAVVEITPPGASSATTISSLTNNFTIDGVSYKLLKSDIFRTATITVTPNVQKTYDKIKTIIDKYNETIEKIQSKINEKKNLDFKPLTDEQKKGMKEEDIKAWEVKAKQGLLKGDSQLQSMLYSLRRTFSDSVNNAGISLKDAGLSTSSDYSEGGKIIIDETKLKSAIQNNGSQVANLFMKSSNISYDPDHKTDSGRYSEVGIFNRINDILKDYTRTTTDSSNNRGILIEKAGIKGSISEFDNTLSNDIKNNYDKRIAAMTQKLVDKENRYYMQFSRLEVAMQRMNDQSSWLAQQLGTSSGT